MNNLVQRMLSGIVYVAVVVAAILVHPLAFAGVFLIVSTLAVREWHVLLQDGKHVRWTGMLLNILLFGAMVVLATTGLSESWRQMSGPVAFVMIVAYIALVIGALIAELALAERAQPAKHWGDLLSGQVMIVLPFICLARLCAIDKWILLTVFVLLWMNDTAAYCVGSLTAKRKNGNHKMAPYISPKKSWEGLIGGALFTVGTALLLSKFGWLDGIQHCSSVWGDYLVVAGFGLVAVIGGTLGDLMESLLKRSVGVKDSGMFLPGHGGVLDRFDSLLLAGPLLLIYTFVMSLV